MTFKRGRQRLMARWHYGGTVYTIWKRPGQWILHEHDTTGQRDPFVPRFYEWRLLKIYLKGKLA